AVQLPAIRALSSILSRNLPSPDDFPAIPGRFSGGLRSSGRADRQLRQDEHAAWAPLMSRFRIHGIRLRRRAPVFSMPCFSPSLRSFLYVLYPPSYALTHSRANLPLWMSLRA